MDPGNVGQARQEQTDQWDFEVLQSRFDKARAAYHEILDKANPGASQGMFSPPRKDAVNGWLDMARRWVDVRDWIANSIPQQDQAAFMAKYCPPLEPAPATVFVETPAGGRLPVPLSVVAKEFLNDPSQRAKLGPVADLLREQAFPISTENRQALKSLNQAVMGNARRAFGKDASPGAMDDLLKALSDSVGEHGKLNAPLPPEVQSINRVLSFHAELQGANRKRTPFGPTASPLPGLEQRRQQALAEWERGMPADVPKPAWLTTPVALPATAGPRTGR